MRIFRSSDAPIGPVDPATFAGQATVQRLAHDETGVPVGVYRVTFSDGGRTNWHRHSGPQWLFVVEGRVRVQRTAAIATISNLATPSSWPRVNVTGTAPYRERGHAHRRERERGDHLDGASER